MHYSRIIFAVILVNAAGITLRYFGLDTYFIFLGFRFHISCILPFGIMLTKDNLSELWSSLRKPLYSRKIIPFFWILLSLLAVYGYFYLSNQIEPGDPDYFYEFGLSSIFDYPLYLAWNFPQLIMLFMTLSIITGSGNLSYLKVLAGLILLFGFEFIPLRNDFSLSGAASFVLLALTASFFVTRLQNIYWFSVIVFSSVWSMVLLSGSSSEVIINIFFAREYSSWEGFFTAGGDYSAFISPSFFLILLCIASMYVMMFRKKIT